MKDDHISVTINLVWNGENQSWVARTTFINLGELTHKSLSLKPTPSRILTLQSGEEYHSDRKAYEVAWQKALDRIKRECIPVQDDKIRVIIKKEIVGKSEQVNVDDLT